MNCMARGTRAFNEASKVHQDNRRDLQYALAFRTERGVMRSIRFVTLSAQKYDRNIVHVSIG